MKKKCLLVLALGLLVVLAKASTCFADSAEVLPKGVFNAGVKANFYFPVTERFNPDGEEEDIAIDFNKRLGSQVFSSLSLVESAFHLPRGSANVGDSVVRFEYQFYDNIWKVLYGLTDRLTVGVKIPYFWNENTVEARLDTRHATVGLNPNYLKPGDPFSNAPLIPIALGGVPLTTKQVKDYLGRGLDVNHDGKLDLEGFGYRPFRSWSGSDISDIEAGIRYQYFNSDNWRLAFTGGARFPTGKLDDPDNLVDLGYGLGAYALLFRINNDYLGFQNLILNATFRYDLVLPDQTVKRIPESVDRPITSNRELVDRNLGDLFEVEASGTYQFTNEWSLALLYKYGFKLKDKVSGNRGFAYSSLEDETAATAHTLQPELSYSTISLYQAKQFPFPFTVSLGYENVFAGSNNFLVQHLFTLCLEVYF